jgi:hypothetical protein
VNEQRRLAELVARGERRQTLPVCCQSTERWVVRITQSLSPIDFNPRTSSNFASCPLFRVKHAPPAPPQTSRLSVLSQPSPFSRLICQSHVRSKLVRRVFELFRVLVFRVRGFWYVSPRRGGTFQLEGSVILPNLGIPKHLVLGQSIREDL